MMNKVSNEMIDLYLTELRKYFGENVLTVINILMVSWDTDWPSEIHKPMSEDELREWASSDLEYWASLDEIEVIDEVYVNQQVRTILILPEFDHLRVSQDISD